PLTHDGWLEIEVDGQRRRIGITRVHLEEDTAKLFHVDGHSLVDFNRSGVPLMEIVSEPDMRSVDEARLYSLKLRQILRYLGVNSGDMEKGAMRFEANISLRPKGAKGYGTRVEIKNLNSFRALLRSLEYEAERQRRVLEAGGTIRQETMGWDEVHGVTVPQRGKEYAHDYRYFPEPDLPPLYITREWVEELRARLPELPDARRERFMAQYKLSRYDADLLTSEKAIADYFEACARQYPDAKKAANWITGELFRLLKATDTEIEDTKIKPQDLVALLKIVDQGTISGSAAKTVFEEMFATGRSAEEIVAEKGLTQISDAQRLGSIVGEVLGENPQAVADYLGGKEAALRFLVGQVMKATRGQANPGLANELLRQELKKLSAS
ncbi:MAG: Asp-tRNA(Asn)/Glu-tRNA(Gln) amidotransferase subunit GatB, partial [Anaerolineae bacterium]